MDPSILLKKLLEIERAVDRGDRFLARTLLLEVESGVLQIQRESMERSSREAEYFRRIA